MYYHDTDILKENLRKPKPIGHNKNNLKPENTFHFHFLIPITVFPEKKSVNHQCGNYSHDFRIIIYLG